jgi:hypothetical protein
VWCRCGPRAGDGNDATGHRHASRTFKPPVHGPTLARPR